jgi:hypothetical protein
VLAEDADSEDEERGKKAERELEDATRAARSAAEVPRDLFAEGDAGEAADRD